MKTITDIIAPIQLLSGSHADVGATGQGCFMNVIAYLNGESQITDESTCVCVTVRPIAVWLNDYLRDDERAILIPYIERAMGSATSDLVTITSRANRAVQMANEMAEYAAESAEYAGYAAAMREAIFQAGLDYLEKVCNPPQEVNQEIIVRANKLLALA